MPLHILAVALAVAVKSVGVGPAGDQAPAAGMLGTVTLPRAVLADGERLAPGAYDVILTSRSPEPVVGQRAEAERWVEFQQNRQVKGRALAVVVPEQDVSEVTTRQAAPPVGGSRVERLRESDRYLRVWFNRGGDQVLVHLPYAAAAP